MDEYSIHPASIESFPTTLSKLNFIGVAVCFMQQKTNIHNKQKKQRAMGSTFGVIRLMTWCLCEADTKPFVSFPLCNVTTKSNNISLSFISLLITVLEDASAPISLSKQLSSGMSTHVLSSLSVLMVAGAGIDAVNPAIQNHKSNHNNNSFFC